MIPSTGLGFRSRNRTGGEGTAHEPCGALSRTGREPADARPPRAQGGTGSAVSPHSLASRLEASSPAHPAHGEKSRCADHTATHHGAGERQRVTRRDEGSSAMPTPCRLDPPRTRSLAAKGAVIHLLSETGQSNSEVRSLPGWEGLVAWARKPLGIPGSRGCSVKRGPEACKQGSG